MAACDEPYMGEESINLPPALKKWPMTSAILSRASGSSPTLKVRELPNPITGIRSLLEGIGFVINVPVPA